MCATSTTAWENVKATEGVAGNDIWGVTDFPTGTIYLHPNGCRILRLVVKGTPSKDPLILKAGFALTLVHESIHASGIRDEGITECDAIHQLPGILVRYFHVKPGVQLRAWMAKAWEVHRTDPPSYQAVC